VKLIFSGTLFIVRECSDNRFSRSEMAASAGFPDQGENFPDRPI